MGRAQPGGFEEHVTQLLPETPQGCTRAGNRMVGWRDGGRGKTESPTTTAPTFAGANERTFVL